MSAIEGKFPSRRKFSGQIYFTFQQTEMAMKAGWINDWLDQGETVLGKLSRNDPAEYAPIVEALEPGTDDILCKMADGASRRIYGYKCEPARGPTEHGDTDVETGQEQVI